MSVLARLLWVGLLGLMGASCSAGDDKGDATGTGGTGSAGAAGAGQGGAGSGGGEGGSAGDSGAAGGGGGSQTDAKPASFEDPELVSFSVKDFSPDATFDLREMPYKTGFAGLEYLKVENEHTVSVVWRQETRCYYLGFTLGAPPLESNPQSVGPRQAPPGVDSPATEASLNFNESDSLAEDGSCPMKITGIAGADAYVSVSGAVKIDFPEPNNPQILRLEFVDALMEPRFFYDETGKVLDTSAKGQGSFKLDATFVFDNSKFPAN